MHSPLGDYTMGRAIGDRPYKRGAVTARGVYAGERGEGSKENIPKNKHIP